MKLYGLDLSHIKLASKERYPSYVPLHYRAYLRLRKSWRQPMGRLAERIAKRQAPAGVLPDGPGLWSTPKASNVPHPRGHINKAAYWVEEDLSEPDIKRLADGIEAVKAELTGKSLRFTNTAATFLSRMFYPRSERDKLWENAWALRHAPLERGMRVMDVGGASTPFSFYLASRGASVAILDNDWNNCGTLYNADHVARKMRWDLKAFDRDVAKPFPFASGSFDRVYSICTVEHLSSPTRRAMMKEVGRILKPGGIAAITLCYDPDHKVLLVDKGLRFGFREKLETDIIKPSNLALYGNTELLDFSDEPHFLGAVFLRK